MDNTNLEFPVFRNQSVVDSIKDWIIDQMIKGNLRPGSKLQRQSFANGSVQGETV